jgi:hypothetical protein
VGLHTLRISDVTLVSCERAPQYTRCSSEHGMVAIKFLKALSSPICRIIVGILLISQVCRDLNISVFHH